MHPFQLGIQQQLEAEASLEIDDSRSQRALRLAKVGSLNVGRDAAGVDVRYVKDVEHVGLDFDLRVFAQDSHVGQTEGFGDGDVDIPVMRGQGRSCDRFPAEG